MTLPNDCPDQHVESSPSLDIYEGTTDAVEVQDASLKRERGFLPVELVMMNLPYRRIAESDWVRVNGNDRMTVTARRFTNTAGQPDRFIPYGKHARAIILYVMTQVKVTKSRDIELGSSFRSFMNQVGIPYSGRNARTAMDQLLALLHCTFDFNVVDSSMPGYLGIENISYPVSDEYSLWFDLRNERLGEDGLLNSKVKINQRMFDSIMSKRTRPVDLKKYAQVASGKSAFALDILVWLSSKVYDHMKKKKTSEHVSWEQLHNQFGSRAPLAQFKRDFEKELDVVLQTEMNAWAYVSRPGQPGITQRKGFKGVIVGYKDLFTEPKQGVMGYAKKADEVPEIEPGEQEASGTSEP